MRIIFQCMRICVAHLANRRWNDEKGEQRTEGKKNQITIFGPKTNSDICQNAMHYMCLSSESCSIFFFFSFFLLSIQFFWFFICRLLLFSMMLHAAIRLLKLMNRTSERKWNVLREFIQFRLQNEILFHSLSTPSFFYTLIVLIHTLRAHSQA